MQFLKIIVGINCNFKKFRGCPTLPEHGSTTAHRLHRLIVGGLRFNESKLVMLTKKMIQNKNFKLALKKST